MFKQPLITILYFLLAAISATGCSSGRKIRSSDLPAGTDMDMMYEYTDLESSSVATDGFFIRKLGIITKIGGNNDSYTANLRKSTDGKWLASIQLLRVEVFRVYADRENVIILDRLRRSAYILAWETLTRRYGLTYDILPSLLGDMPRLSRQVQKAINCNNLTKFEADDLKYAIITDCKIPRSKEMIITSHSSDRTIYVRAEEYGLSAERYYTSVVSVKEKSGAIDILLNINEITIPWDGEIDFTIPANYKVER